MPRQESLEVSTDVPFRDFEIRLAVELKFVGSQRWDGSAILKPSSSSSERIKDITNKSFWYNHVEIWFSDETHGWLLGNIVSGTSSTGYDIVSADCNPNAVRTS